MTEIICSNGHVVNNGFAACQRCNAPVIGTVDTAPEIVAEATVDLETLTAKELREKCIEQGIEFKGSDSKAVLIEKLSSVPEESAEEDEEESEESDEDESEEEESEDSDEA